MKKTIYPLAFAAILIFAATAHADERNQGPRPKPDSYAEIREELRARIDARLASSTERFNELRDRIEDRKASTTARNLERKASTTARHIEVQQNIAKRQAEQARKVLAATIEHLENILARVESRIAKIKADSGDTALSEGFVAEVKTHLSAAKASLAAFSSIEITSDKASENFEAVRQAGKEVKGHIKEAHASLMKAIRALKPGRDDDRNATSTPEREDD